MSKCAQIIEQGRLLKRFPDDYNIVRFRNDNRDNNELV